LHSVREAPKAEPDRELRAAKNADDLADQESREDSDGDLVVDRVGDGTERYSCRREREDRDRDAGRDRMEAMLESLTSGVLVSGPRSHGCEQAEQDACDGGVHATCMDADPGDDGQRPKEPSPVETVTEREPVERADREAAGKPGR